MDVRGVLMKLDNRLNAAVKICAAKCLYVAQLGDFTHLENKTSLVSLTGASTKTTHANRQSTITFFLYTCGGKMLHYMQNKQPPVIENRV